MNDSPVGTAAPPAPWSRRNFIKVAGSATVLAAVDVHTWLGAPAEVSFASDGGLFTIDLIRPDDQLRLRFEFLHLAHDTATNQLVASGDGPPMMRLLLARQHTAEAPIEAGATPPGAGSAPIAHRVAGFSRLVFDVAPPIDLDVATLLDLARYDLRTTTVAGDPGDEQTLIELPADFGWSPAADVSVVADIDPVTRGEVTQVHRLALDAPGDIALTPLHNAATTNGFAGRTPNSADRDQMIEEAAAEGPALAERVELTPHGARAEIAGEWSTISWIQRIDGGRDRFAQTVNRGVLMPFGHPAVWTETNTRLWLADTDGQLVSTLVSEHQFAVVGTPTIDFPGPYSPADGRSLPFRSVTIDPVDALAAGKGSIEWDDTESISDADAWFVTYRGDEPWAGSNVRVSYTVVDRAGGEHSFSLPAVFVRTDALDDPDVALGLAAFYASTDGQTASTTSSLRDLAWVEPLVAGSGLTTFYTTSLTLGLHRIVGVSADDLAAAGQLPVAPVALSGTVFSDGVIGANGALADIDVEWSVAYLIAGNNPAFNPSGAFLTLPTPTAFPLGSEARAVMTPDFVAGEFNQALGIGPVLEDVGGGHQWTPSDAFGDQAKVFGGVLLSELVDAIDFDLAVPGVDIPELTVITLPESISQTIRWCPDDIRSAPVAGFVTSGATRLCVEIESTVALSPAVEAGTTVEFSISDFTLVVPPQVGLVELDVNELRAVETSTGTSDLTLDIDTWRLGGALSWLQPLIRLLTPAGSEFEVEVVGSEILVALDVPVPGLDLGVLSISGFSIGLDGAFPFDGSGQPRLEIGVGSDVAPIGLQIAQFRGEFWCTLGFSATELDLLHISAAASARLFEIDIKVAEAYCEVGISADFTLRGGDVSFKGTLSLTAHFDVGGVIGASLSIQGTVRYEEADETMTISGTIFWSVTAVVTFNGSVPIGTIDFRLGGGQAGAAAADGLAARAVGASAGSGSFGDVHSLATWTDYVGAFAPEA